VSDEAAAVSSLHVPVSSVAASPVFASLGASGVSDAVADDASPSGFVSAFTSVLHSADACKQLKFVTARTNLITTRFLAIAKRPRCRVR